VVNTTPRWKSCMGDRPSTSNLGSVASVRGSAADMRFEHRLPPIYSLLRAGVGGRIVIEVRRGLIFCSAFTAPSVGMDTLSLDTFCPCCP
jgi:hypothetical protein